MVDTSVNQKLESLPTSAGVYLFVGKGGVVLYVGKASNLRTRVRSYFQPGSSDVRAFVALLESELENIETFVTGTEKEATLLEQQLVKNHQPRYNVKLRDDKDYLSLRIDSTKTWPRIEVVRRPKADGAMYFGPYSSATSARQTLRLVNRHFQLRTCTDSEFKNRIRPCLQYQIKRCPAPCVLEVDSEAYAAQVQNVGKFLNGRHDELLDDLKLRMQSASEVMLYEQAALYRDQIHAVEKARESQYVASVQSIDQDAIGFHRQADQGQIAVLVVRHGKLLRVQTYDLRDLAAPNDEMIATFVHDFYTGGAKIPDEILLPLPIEAAQGLAEVLSEKKEKRVQVLCPQRGNKVRLVELAQRNAQHAFEEKRRATEDLEGRLTEVQRRLHLKHRPDRIECVDISHTGGEQTSAVFVSIEKGAPLKSGYRSFVVKRAKGGDDYAALYEVILRRLRRGRDEEKGWLLPNLLLIDGGKGQLSVAIRARDDLKMDAPELASIAKERQNVHGQLESDRVFRPGWKNAVPIHAHASMTLLAMARDEAHRASNELRKRIGRRKKLKSSLDDIRGVGPKTTKKLLIAFGSVAAVERAHLHELIEAGITRAQAKALVDAFGQPSKPSTPTTDDAEVAAVNNAFVSD